MGQTNDQMSVEISNRPSENTKNENRLPTVLGILNMRVQMQSS
jgi:hypothetical protein